MDDLDKLAEADYLRDRKLISSSITAKDIYTLAWLRGRTHGVNEEMKRTISPEDEAKLASVTISEHFNHELYGQVLQAQKQTQ